MTVKHVTPPPVYQGWVNAGEVDYCDACNRRVWVWELHHLVPVDWGGNKSRADRDHYVVWVKACGDCHNTVHRILDHCKPLNRWDGVWVEDMAFPLHMVRIARWGWNLAVHQQIVGL